MPTTDPGKGEAGRPRKDHVTDEHNRQHRRPWQAAMSRQEMPAEAFPDGPPRRLASASSPVAYRHPTYSSRRASQVDLAL